MLRESRPSRALSSVFVGFALGLADIAHGDTLGSLLHEGSAVGPGGGKFVIRTELLFEAQGYGAFKPT